MSVSVMSEVFKRYPVGDAEMLLALALADHADDHGEHIWPSVPSLAQKTRQSERSVQRQLRKMEADRWLLRVSTKKIGRGQTVEYRINPDWLKGDNLSPFSEEKRVTNETERVTPGVEKGDKCGAAYKEEPSLTIKEPSSARARNPQPKIALPDWLDPELWKQYVDHRKEIKSRLTHRAAELSIGTLDKLRKQGFPPREVIEQTIFNGWVGLFPIKQQAVGKPGQRQRMSETELLRLGAEIGIEPKPGESLPDFAARIDAARCMGGMP